jgi:hypothetical protein
MNRLNNSIAWKRVFGCAVILAGMGSLLGAQPQDPLEESEVRAEETQGAEQLQSDDRHLHRTHELATYWQQKHQRVLAKLEQPVDYKFSETPLEEVIEYFSSANEINFSIDNSALDTLGLDSSLPITQQMRDVALRQALGLILSQHDLTYVVREGIAVVTSQEEAEESLVVRTYSVRDLLTKRQPNESMDKLIDVITTCVEPDTWQHVGGPGAICPYQGVLVVDQTDRIHTDIERLLTQLRSEINAAGGPTIPIAVPTRREGGGRFGGRIEPSRRAHDVPRREGAVRD